MREKLSEGVSTPGAEVPMEDTDQVSPCFGCVTGTPAVWLDGLDCCSMGGPSRSARCN